MIHILSHASDPCVPAAWEVVLSAAHRSALRDALDEAAPRECCGVLLGIRDGRRMEVRHVIPLLNTAGVHGSFAIPDAELRRARQLAARRGEPIVALFHSHPCGSRELSVSDRLALTYSEWAWVILTPSPASRDVELTCYLRTDASAMGGVELPCEGAHNVKRRFTAP